MKEVYMDQPSGLVNPSFLTMCTSFKKALHYLKQAPRAWYEHLGSKFSETIFQHSHADTSLFIHHSDSHSTIVIVFLDFILIMVVVGFSSCHFSLLFCLLLY